MRYINARNTAYGEDRRTYKESDSGVSSTQRVFNVSYDNGRVEAYLNGVRLFPDEDYTKTSSGIGTSITLASDLGSNNVLEIVGYQGINSGNALVEDNFVVGTGSTGSGGTYTNSTTVFPVASSPGDTVSVWRNGVKLVPTTDYTVQASANTVTLVNPGASTDDEITVQVVGGVIHNNGLTVNSGNDSFFLPTTRGTNNYILTRDDTVGTGGTAWKETMLTPIINSLTYPDGDDGNPKTALDSGTGAGTETLIINGSNFTTTITSVKITVGGSPVDLGGSVVRNSSEQITVSSVTKRTAGTYTITVTNDTGLTGTTNVIFSGTPSFDLTGQANGSLGSILHGATLNKTITTAGGDGTITIKADPSGSAKPTWMTIGGTGSGSTTWTEVTGTAGLTTALAGSASTSSSTSELQTFGIIVRDSQNQGSDQNFSITVYQHPSGGTLGSNYTSGGVTYRVHIFGDTGNEPALNQTAVSTFTVNNTTTGVDILIVGGGGGGAAGGTGANVGAGGGGAGGMRVLTNQTLNIGTYNVTVGGGGSGGDYSSSTHTFNVAGARSGRKGVTSSIIQQTGTGSFSYSAEGGGHGDYQMSGHLYSTVQASQSGGSGGGASNINANHGTGVGTGSNGDTPGYYGSDGGDANGNEGGGGGGAGQAGQTGPGDGGDGLSNSFRTGTGISYAGGGGGARYSGHGGNGSGGTGGGGSAVGSGTPGHGTDGKGGGGGGTVNQSTVDGGNGGSGIVIIRYAI